MPEGETRSVVSELRTLAKSQPRPLSERSDPAAMATVVRRIVGGPSQRDTVGLLAHLIRACHAAAPGGWCTTLWKDRVRLNFTAVIVLDIFDGGLSAMVDTQGLDDNDRALLAPWLDSEFAGFAHYRDVGQALVPVAQVGSLSSALRRASSAFIARVTDRGLTTWWRAHAPAVPTFLREHLATEVPDPEYAPAIAARRAPAERIARRAAAEDEARALIAEHLGGLDEASLQRLLTLMDTDVFQGKPVSRFGLAFVGANRRRLLASVDVINRWLPRLWSAEGRELDAAIDGLLTDADQQGAGRMLVSGILYLRDRQRFTWWSPALRRGLEQLAGGSYVGPRNAASYAQFNAAATRMRERWGIAPQALDVVLGFAGSEGDDSGAGDTKPQSGSLEAARQVFLRHLPGFKSFQDVDSPFHRDEIVYKRQAVAQARATLGPFVDGSRQFESDAEARAVAEGIFELTNFLNWRDRQYIDGTLLAAEGAWTTFMRRVVACLREIPAGEWETALEALLDWLRERECSANVSKALPTYFLFLWSPESQIHIKPSAMDRFLQLIGLPRLGAGRRLDLESYRRVLAACETVREGLADWEPRDLLDIHGFVWVSSGGWGEPPGDPPLPPEPPVPPQPEVRDAPKPENVPSHLAGVPLNLILAGPPGTGKTYRLNMHYRRLFSDDRVEWVTFHQSYSYEDFVEGIKPVMRAGAIQYEVQDGVFKRLVSRALLDPQHAHALFVDEINRANISNVFGELITLLEDDKRLTWNAANKRWEGGIRVRLPYTHAADPGREPFGVPNNLYVIGTMNTADRSIALLDLALRRRFTFEEVMPDLQALRGRRIEAPDGGDPIQLDQMLDHINQRVEFLYDRDHAIGHSYLIEVKTFDDLVRAFLHKIIPLLQEYFYGNWEKVQLVLGDLTDERESADGGPRLHPDAIVEHVVQPVKQILGLSDSAYEPVRSYRVRDELSPASFRKIYR